MCTVSRRRLTGSSTTMKNTAQIRTTPAKYSCEDDISSASCASTTWGFAQRGTGTWSGTISTPGSVFTDSLAPERCITSIQPIAWPGAAICHAIRRPHTLVLIRQRHAFTKQLEECSRLECGQQKDPATVRRAQAKGTNSFLPTRYSGARRARAQ